MDFKGRKVLVVGGAGYVGSVVASMLLDAGAQVRVLDQLIYDNGFALQHLLDNERLSLLRGDLCDAATFARAAQGVSDVVLLASLVGDPICKKYPDLARRVNQEAALRIIDSLDALGVKRFVFTSTCSNYGIHDPATLASETAELNPQSLYAQTKISVEQHLLAASRAAQCSGTVLRVATAYGLSPRMRFDLTVSQFTWELASGRPLLVYDADTWRPYCHVRDIAGAIIAVLEHPADAVRGEVFNVGENSQQFTKRMIVEQVQRHLADTQVEYRSGDTDPRNYRVSFDKIAHRLGFRCKNTVEAYIPRLIAAVQAGVFPDVHGNSRFGNFEVRHLT
jgi:nucleoside-diphosphate-sugar epimerase